MRKTVGSICSGIEAASVAWNPLGFSFEWFSETAAFPSKVLSHHYPKINNLGCMTGLAEKLKNGEIASPDIICGGTPCQAFSYAGWKEGLADNRGNLTLCFAEIVNANDVAREKQGLGPCAVLWENVEGVLSCKTNAFGIFLSYMAGVYAPLYKKQWPAAGVLIGPKRNVAWRVLDAKYFGVPQQRRRLYVLAGGRTFKPQNVLFEDHSKELVSFPQTDLIFTKNNVKYEVFREYTDCLYSAYGTKWNGNAAANNGSLFVVESGKIRRFSPLECERLMGLPDNYTDIPEAKKTNRYQAIGNSWAVPVITWIGKRLMSEDNSTFNLQDPCNFQCSAFDVVIGKGSFFDFGAGIVPIDFETLLNASVQPENPHFSSIQSILSPCTDESIYISPVGCQGIIRRSNERETVVNSKLKSVLQRISAQMPHEEIERKSMVQARGRYSEMQKTG